MRLLVLPLLLIALSLAAGCSTRRAATPVTAEPVRAEEPVASGAPAEPMALADTTICVVDRASPTGLASVQAKRVVATGEVVIPDGQSTRSLAERYPGDLRNGYAQGESWFIQNTPIEYSGLEYQKYGVQRRIQPEALQRGGDISGVAVFLDPRDGASPEILYLAVAPGCVFQPYRALDRVREIRGE